MTPGLLEGGGGGRKGAPAAAAGSQVRSATHDLSAGAVPSHVKVEAAGHVWRGVSGK